MTIVNYRHGDGTLTSVDACIGDSLCAVALDHDVAGIVGECGGQLSCATCHVYVEEPWLIRASPMSDLEDEMLDCTACPRLAASRLGCQLVIEPEWDGFTVLVPDTQY